MEPQQVSISEAARLVGRARRSLYRDIKAGRLSVTVTHTGAHKVDVTELLRVYGAFSGSVVTSHSDSTVPMSHRVISDGTPDDTVLQARNSALEAEVSQLRELLAAKNKNLDDLRSAMKLLEYHKTGFWGRIFGGKSG